MAITLEEGQTGKYFASKYSEFSPTGIKKANRTLNQYSVTFNCTKKKHSLLMTKIKEDTQIIEAITASNNHSKIETGTNDKHSKVSPIKTNN